jgi:hypothetical protein
MPGAERILAAILRFVGAMALLAVVPVFMPHAWMDGCHDALGLGTLPETPIIVYLTRSLSALYAFHGGLMWLVAADLRRYAAVVTYFGCAFLTFGAVILWIDFHAGLPWAWIACEGPFLICYGLAILVLQHSRADPG